VTVEDVESSTEFVYDLTVEHTRVFQVYNGINLFDTFHTAGAGCKAMTTGVPRFTELLNATPKPKIVNCDIRFLYGNATVQELRKTVGSSIVGLTLSDIFVSCSYHTGKEPEKWYAAYDALYDNRMEAKLKEMNDCVSYTLNIEKMYKYNLSLQEIAESIEDGFASSYCIFSAPSLGRLDVYVDTSEIELPEERLLYVTQENRIRVFLEEVVHNTLSKLVICGIPNITEMYFEKKDGDWTLTTVGKNYKRVLAHPAVDFANTVSNDVWDIYNTLGIEASRSFLLEELAGVMTINECHIKILIDKMTHSGTITAITRHTLKKDDTGPLGRSSFEESVDNFLLAAQRGEIERMEGCSGCIMTGKRAPVGTGKMGLRVDINALLPLSEIPDQEYIQIDNKIITEIATNSSQKPPENPTFVEIEL
jgi:DNA-directed RNA polymerase beta' subunit